MYPSLADVLEIPVVAAGRPVVRAGRSELGAAVHWVHVSELRDPAGTLSGGVLVLSIGVAASDPATDPGAYLSGLRAAGAVGLMIELGQHLRALPDALVQAARAMAFPLVELQRTVRFVELTEAVHARVLTGQYARLQFAQRVGETFRGLAVDGADDERVVGEAARLLELPVVLEDLGHRALSVAGGDPRRVLLDWMARSRRTPDSPATDTAGPEGWTTAPVGRRGQRWGRLVAPLRSGDDRVHMVLAEAAAALTLLGLVAPDATPGRQAESLLLADLLAAPHSPGTDLRARAGALGLPTTGHLAVLVLHPGGGPAASSAATRAAATQAAAVQGAAIQGAGVQGARTPPSALVGDLPGGAVGVVLPCPSPDAEESTVLAFLDGLPAGEHGVPATASAPGFAALSDAVAEAMHVADVVLATATPEPRSVWRARDLGVRGLLHELRDDPRLLSYLDDQLGPVLRLDAARRADLLFGVRAFAEADGVVSAFAARIGTSRPAAYARVRKLSAALGRDLGDPIVKLSLQTAVLALDATGLESEPPGAPPGMGASGRDTRGPS